MTTTERWTPPLIWAFFLCEGIRGGVTFPYLDVGVAVPLNSTIKLVLTIMPLVSFALMWPIIKRMNRNQTAMKSLVDKVFTEGAYERMGSRMHFDELGIIFFCLAGGIGSAISFVKGRPELNLFFSLFSLSAGLGLLCGTIISRAIDRKLGSV